MIRNLTLVTLLLFCCCFLGCGRISFLHSKPPSGEQIEAALDAGFKKDNPSASAKLTGIEMNKGGNYLSVTFSCTNCVVEGQNGKKTLPSGKGAVGIGHNPEDDKWVFMTATVDGEDGQRYVSALNSKF
jgi:hypothetical protein